MKLTKRQLKRIIESNLTGDSGDDMKPVKIMTGDDNDEETINLQQDTEIIDDFYVDSPMDKRVNRRTFLKGLLGLTATFLAGGILKLTGGSSGSVYHGEPININDNNVQSEYCRNLLKNIKKYQPQWLEPGNPIRYFIDASEFEATGGGTAYPYAFDANTQTFYYISDADFQSFLFDAYGPEKISQLLDAEIQQAKNEIMREEEKLKTRPEYADTWRENIDFFTEELNKLQSPGYIPDLDFWAINNLNLYFNAAMPENLYFYDYEYGIQRYAGTNGTMRYAPGRDHAYNGGIEIDQGGKKVFIKLDPPADDYP
jgi:hypothetical protein